MVSGTSQLNIATLRIAGFYQSNADHRPTIIIIDGTFGEYDTVYLPFIYARRSLFRYLKVNNPKGYGQNNDQKNNETTKNLKCLSHVFNLRISSG